VRTLAPRPKSRIADADVLLADTVVPTTTLVRTSVQNRRCGVRDSRSARSAPGAHPSRELGLDMDRCSAGRGQGLAPRLSTAPEPVAAATWFAQRHDFPVGAFLGVLDFGGGTCDAAVVRRERSGLTVARCAGLPDLYGVNNGGRFSLDRTYLADALATGLVTIAPLHVVTEIGTGSAHRYVLRCDRIDTDGAVQEHVVVETDALFVNAGSANTSRCSSAPAAAARCRPCRPTSAATGATTGIGSSCAPHP
jgi:hypothetical protein